MALRGRLPGPLSAWRGAAGLAAAGVLVGSAALASRASSPPHAVEAATAAGDALGEVAPVPYNGDFTFTRVRFIGAWSHDYPDADRNMQFILEEFTAMHLNTSDSNVLDLEDVEIFRHPVLYLSEPGTWRITELGAQNLRAHLSKGGFIIFDDFDGFGHWESFAAQIARVLPGAQFVELSRSHPIFDTFFFVEDIYIPHPFANVRPQYLAVFEDNDPSKRMLMLINYNADLAEYWEFAAQGFFPVDPTNDAFRLGVNYFIYALTR